MPPAQQWIHTTTGRIATCAHSWMQAVHWIAGSGLYTPSRAHGPKWGPTTIAIAQEISALKECRPGVDYLARKLKVAERTVQYHLGMLREAGLLVYRSKGTRIQGVGGRASVFERVIPIEFDEALGIRTIGEGAMRRPVGAAEESRTLLGKLAKKAARKARRRPRRKSSSAERRCTPMQVGTSGTSSADRTYSPPESKLASGTGKSSTRKQAKRGPRKLNKVGRRYQLAKELIQLVPWLRGASIPRIAWIIRHVADAGWTVLEVQAAAERFISDKEPRRPSAVLAFRLASCHLLYTTPDRRKVLVEDWQDSRRAEQARHSEAAQHADHVQGPGSVSVQDLFREAARRVNEIAYGPVDDAECFEINVEDGTPPLDLADLDPVWIQQVRKDAAEDLSSITSALASGMSDRDARRLYTNWLVDQALAAQRRSELAPAF
ncbi:helix-turn-helix domain-containing protein [Streptomyces violaceus]|uniref:Helix-turn-helix domain-containing protein n=1 Tax=Streptomyces violaceus TaxID=1936 RepID=A0ABY9UML7_STRVL|nr:helix-turn-helix domain-containing protein [Streptomyces janthinus]WND24152.1 helix-turn-helix domain-containing protein [Streptomyces janthinus]